MSFRVVNGSTRTENGWRCCNRDECDIVKISELYLTETAPIRTGAPLVILGAWMYWYDRNVEEITTSIWGWSQDNDVLGSYGANMGSNHLSGTAIDINAPMYPWGSFRMPADKVAKVREGLALFSINGESGIFWGRTWGERGTSKADEMHYQMAWPEGDPRNDQLAQKLLDGYLGIYKQAVGSSGSRAVSVLAQATGITQGKAAAILSQVQFALDKANCTTPRRIAAALAQWIVESGHFVYTEEIASGPESQERWKYKGRTWIQLTWLENYQGFSRWCYSLGLVPTPDYFVLRPKELAEQKWAALGPAYWWAVKYPQINEYADRGDIDNVSKWVNAPAWVDNPNKHANGEKERRDAYNQALSLGNQLLVLVASGTIDPIEELLMIEVESWSIYADPGEPKIPAIQMVQALDAHGPHEPYVEAKARTGDLDSIRRIARTAAGLGKYGNAAGPMQQALDVLLEIQAAHPEWITAANPRKA